MRPRPLLVAIVLAAALLGCSDGDESSDGDGDGGTSSSSSSSTSSSTTDPSGSSSSSSSTSTSASADPPLTVDELCERAEAYTAEIERMTNEDDATAREKVAAIEAEIGDRVLPDEIAADFALYLEGLRRFADYTEDYADDPTTATSYTEHEARTYEAASRTVAQFLASECGI